MNAMTPSQRARWKRHAYYFRWEATVRCTDAETVRLTDAVMAGAPYPVMSPDIDARCQPVKVWPERYDSEGNFRA